MAPLGTLGSVRAIPGRSANPRDRTRPCERCGEPFTSGRVKARFCSGQCRAAAARGRTRKALLTEVDELERTFSAAIRRLRHEITTRYSP